MPLHATKQPLSPDRAKNNCGEIAIRIGRDGTWFYHGSPIGRKEMVSLFASVLSRQPDGSYWLVTPFEAGRIIVDDAPFVAVESYICGAGREMVISMRTNVDEIVTLDAEHPLRVETHPETGEPSPYIFVRDGLEARLSRPVYYELVALGFEEEFEGQSRCGIWSGSVFHELGSLAE
jgi:hypothetical protein